MGCVTGSCLAKGSFLLSQCGKTIWHGALVLRDALPMQAGKGKAAGWQRVGGEHSSSQAGHWGPEPFPQPGALLPRVQNLEDGCIFSYPASMIYSMWLCSEHRTSLTGTWEGRMFPVPSHNCFHTHGASWASSPLQLEHSPGMQEQPTTLHILGCSASKEGDRTCISPQEAAPTELGCNSFSPKPSNKSPTPWGAAGYWRLPHGSGMGLRTYCAGLGAGVMAGAHTGHTKLCSCLAANFGRKSR